MSDSSPSDDIPTSTHTDIRRTKRARSGSNEDSGDLCAPKRARIDDGSPREQASSSNSSSTLSNEAENAYHTDYPQQSGKRSRDEFEEDGSSQIHSNKHIKLDEYSGPPDASENAPGDVTGDVLESDGLDDPLHQSSYGSANDDLVQQTIDHPGHQANTLETFPSEHEHELGAEDTEPFGPSSIEEAFAWMNQVADPLIWANDPPWYTSEDLTRDAIPDSGAPLPYAHLDPGSSSSPHTSFQQNDSDNAVNWEDPDPFWDSGDENIESQAPTTSPPGAENAQELDAEGAGHHSPDHSSVPQNDGQPSSLPAVSQFVNGELYAGYSVREDYSTTGSHVAPLPSGSEASSVYQSNDATEPKKRTTTKRKQKSKDAPPQVYVDTNGCLWWSQPGRHGDQWLPAVRHADIRGQLIAQAAQAGAYVYSREHYAKGTHDETAFLPSQQDWGVENTTNVIGRVRALANGHNHPRAKNQQPIADMMYGGKIVIDEQSNPVRDFADLPAAISSKIEPFFLYAVMFVDRRIVINDIKARMPRHPKCGTTGLVNRRLRWNNAHPEFPPIRTNGKREKHTTDNTPIPSSSERSSGSNEAGGDMPSPEPTESSPDQSSSSGTSNGQDPTMPSTPGNVSPTDDTQSGSHTEVAGPTENLTNTENANSTLADDDAQGRDPLYYASIQPQNDFERECVARAIQAAKASAAAFIQLHGSMEWEAAETDPNASYADQFEEIFSDFELFWQVTCHGTDSPKLRKVVHWPRSSGWEDFRLEEA